MIILDTNVVSELSAPVPSPNVIAWIASQPATDLYITSVIEAEILAGSERMPQGRRRSQVAAANARVINEVLGGRVLPFDRNAARHYAQIRAHRERIGHPIGRMDCMIAAIAQAHQAAVATRDTGGFAHCGIPLINPWQNLPPQPAQGSLTQ